MFSRYLDIDQLNPFHNVNSPYLLVFEVIGGDFIQLVDEWDVSSVLVAVEDAFKDGLVFGVDVVVLQDTEDVGNQHWVESNIYIIRHQSICQIWGQVCGLQ